MVKNTSLSGLSVGLRRPARVFCVPEHVTIAGLQGEFWIVASSDFNGDGKSDILWQNDNGQVAIWELNGTTVIGGGVVGNPGPSWEVIATGDFCDGDGRADILWQNRQRGGRDLGIERHQVSSPPPVLGNPGPELARHGGPATYNRRRHAPTFSGRTATATIATWGMNGSSVIGSASLANPGPTWHV